MIQDSSDALESEREITLKPSPRIYWRASLEPAAAVIGAPIAYINVVVVKSSELDLGRLRAVCLLELLLYNL